MIGLQPRDQAKGADRGFAIVLFGRDHANQKNKMLGDAALIERQDAATSVFRRIEPSFRQRCEPAVQQAPDFVL
jgi:hypothetical protein